MNKLADISTQFSEWYQEVLVAADLIDQSPTKGCMVIKPYGYAIWEFIQAEVDAKIKEKGVANAYFPLLIPESFLKKEADHIAGFSPELAVVTHAGGKQLEENYVIRPTSETIIYHMFSRWIKSWRDLPLKVNQWANVVRWEMRTRPFLRTTEFLWQEGHTAHATKEEAVAFAESILELYRVLAEDFLAIPVVTGRKSKSEQFAGGERTLTFEGLMQDGKALQMGTSHVLAQSFPRSFDVFFQDKDGTITSPHCTSWGITTRLIGAIIMVHGDDRGLVLPVPVAPIQVVIVPIFKTDEEKEKVLAAAQAIAAACKTEHIRAFIDEDTEKTPGAKFFHWEVRGVPVRIEIGPRDVAAGSCMMMDRLSRDKKDKKPCALTEVISTLKNTFVTYQKNLFEKAKQRRAAQWYHVKTFDEVATQLEQKPGFYQVGWCGNGECEASLKDIKATIRCCLQEHKQEYCFVCGAKSTGDVLVAKSY